MHWYCVGLLWNGTDWYCPNGCLEDGSPRLGVLVIFYRHRQVRGALGEVLLQGDLADVAQNWTLGLIVQLLKASLVHPLVKSGYLCSWCLKV